MTPEHGEVPTESANEACSDVSVVIGALSSKDWTPQLQVCPDEFLVERYVLKQMTEDEELTFEEHWLFCEACQEEVAKLDDLIATLKLLRDRGSPLMATN